MSWIRMLPLPQRDFVPVDVEHLAAQGRARLDGVHTFEL